MLSTELFKTATSLRQKPNTLLPRAREVLDLGDQCDISEDSIMDLNALPLAKNFTPG